MSTRKQKVINIMRLTLKTICWFMVGLIMGHLIFNATNTNEQIEEEPKVQTSVKNEKEENDEYQYMEYLQDLPDAGVTKTLYQYMNKNTDKSHNDFIYAYSLMTETPCVGVETIIQEDAYKASAVKVEVHTLNKVKATIVEEGEPVAEPTVTPTPTSVPTPTLLQKIYENENLSAETQHDALYLANKYDVPIEILLGIAYKETRYTAGLVSADKHDYGFCQIRDVNHSWLEKEIGRDLDFLNSEYDSMEAACFMLRNFKNEYPTSSWGFILLCYNGGEDYANRLASKGIWGSSYTQEVLAKAYSLGWTEE